METFMQYELAPQPPSLFLDGQIRKTEKRALGKMMKSLIDYQNTIPDDAIFVIDGCTSAYIVIAPNLPTTTTQAAFLGNNCNKARPIATLSLVLTSSGITVKQAESDADTLIVSTAFHMADGSECDQPVVVVETDTDLLVMLVARAT